LRFPFELSFASDDEVFLKLASFFIHDAKGLRRPCRSGLWSASFFICSYLSFDRELSDDAGGP
jgi:hypothetical protein